MSERTDLAVAFRTLGCKVNRVESENIAAELLGGGARVVDECDADVIVINTCTVTREADVKARKAIRHALRSPREPLVLVTGCLAALDAPSLEVLGARVIVEADKARVAARVAAARRTDVSPQLTAAAPTAAEGLASDTPATVRRGGEFRTRVSLKIEDGCDNFCSYCIVPYARGVPRGEALTRVVADAQALVDAGVREFVLTGINLGRYRDPATGVDLADLIRAVAATGIARLRLSSIEPPDLTPRLLAALAETPAACRQLHVPLQSGSDPVLSAMGRSYTTAEYSGVVASARQALPGLTLTTDVIAGFPTESAENHAETLAFIQRVGFSKLHVFRYSERPGTLAASLAQLAPEVRAVRAAELRELGDRQREAFLTSHLGVDVEVLVETVEDANATGTTRDYVRVSIPGTGLARGQLVTATVGGVIGGRLVARACTTPTTTR